MEKFAVIRRINNENNENSSIPNRSSYGREICETGDSADDGSKYKNEKMKTLFSPIALVFRQFFGET